MVNMSMLLVWKISTRSSTYSHGKSTSMDVNFQLNFVLSDQIKISKGTVLISIKTNLHTPVDFIILCFNLDLQVITMLKNIYFFCCSEFDPISSRNYRKAPLSCRNLCKRYKVALWRST